MCISGVDLWDEGVDFVEFLQSKHILPHCGLMAKYSARVQPAIAKKKKSLFPGQIDI